MTKGSSPCSSSSNRRTACAAAHVHREVNLRELALAEREVVLNARALEPPHEQLLQTVAQLGVERVARHHDQERHVAPVRVAALEQPHPPLLLEREQYHQLAAQLLDGRDEQLSLREAVEDRDDGLVVV